MTDLINADPKPAFATVLAVTVMVLTVVLVRGRRAVASTSPREHAVRVMQPAWPELRQR